ncbi:hypothetical protein ACLOJK_034354 [Asimina triloba]
MSSSLTRASKLSSHPPVDHTLKSWSCKTPHFVWAFRRTGGIRYSGSPIAVYRLSKLLLRKTEVRKLDGGQHKAKHSGDPKRDDEAQHVLVVRHARRVVTALEDTEASWVTKRRDLPKHLEDPGNTADAAAAE